MKLYSIKDNSTIIPISNTKFDFEREIQVLFERNLVELFNLQFVKSEFSIRNFRIDTLGFDNENKSFVIIEYKKDRNFSVIDQGYTYMSLMLNNKSDFILEYNENCGGVLKRDDIDWSQSKVIFVSPHFTEYQKHSINFKDVPFELWEVKKYENNMIGLVQHKTTSDESIKTISDDKTNVVNQVSKEIIKYDEEYLLNKSKERTPEFKEFYYDLKNMVLDLGNVDVKVNGKFITFLKENNPFLYFIIYKNRVGITLNLKKGELDDVLNKTEDISDKEHWGTGDYIIWVRMEDDLEYILNLIKQSYFKHL